MSEDCQNCGTMMWLLDAEGLCPACNGFGFYDDGEPIYEDSGFIQKLGTEFSEVIDQNFWELVLK